MNATLAVASAASHLLPLILDATNGTATSAALLAQNQSAFAGRQLEPIVDFTSKNNDSLTKSFSSRESDNFTLHLEHYGAESHIALKSIAMQPAHLLKMQQDEDIQSRILSKSPEGYYVFDNITLKVTIWLVNE